MKTVDRLSSGSIGRLVNPRSDLRIKGLELSFQHLKIDRCLRRAVALASNLKGHFAHLRQRLAQNPLASEIGFTDHVARQIIELLHEPE